MLNAEFSNLYTAASVQVCSPPVPCALLTMLLPQS